MLRSFYVLLLALLATAPLQAQSVRYVSDKVFIVLHKGPGTEYRWAAKLTPGTRLEVAQTASDGKWSEVTTQRGTTGWVQSEFLTAESPAQVKLPAALARAEKLTAKNAELNTELKTLQQEKQDGSKQILNGSVNFSARMMSLTRLF